MACFIRKVSLLGIALIVLFPNTSVVYAAGAACGNAGHGWLPWPWAEYKGRSFTQRDHCGKTRTMVGTKDHSYWVNGVYLPVASSVCKNKLFNIQMEARIRGLIGGPSQAVIGGRAPIQSTLVSGLHRPLIVASRALRLAPESHLILTKTALVIISTLV